MVDNRLLNYVKAKKKEGYSNETIKEAMLKGGYSRQDVDDLFYIIEPNKNEVVERKNFITKTGNLFGNPKKLFGWAIQEDYSEMGKYFGTLYGIIFGLLFLIGFVNLLVDSNFGGIVLLFFGILIGLGVFALIHLLISFIFASLFRFLLLSFGHKTEYLVNLRIMLYSLVPYFFIIAFTNSPIFKWILVFDVGLGFLSINPYLIFSFFLVAAGLSEAYGIKQKRALLYAFVPLGVLLLVLLGMFFNFVEFRGWLF